MASQSDFSELHRLVRDLGAAPTRAYRDLEGVVKKGADNIKTEMASDASGSRHFKGKSGRGLAASISYDSHYRLNEIAFEVGPDKARGGGIGNIAYFGGANGGGGTLDIDKPIRSEEPRLDAAISRILDGLL